MGNRPDAVETVRRIFKLTIEGKGPCDIARILAEDKVERPSHHMTVRGIANRGYHDMTHPYAWSGNTIAHILSKPEYVGHTVNFRTYKDSYKDKQYKFTPKEDLVIFENTHPAIIDSETFEMAQRCRKTVRRTDSLGEANPLTGLVFCADCGGKMYNHRIPHRTEYTNAKGKTYSRPPKDDYSCSTYSLTNRKFNKQCTQHYIRTVVIRETSAIKQNDTAKSSRKQLAKNQKRIAELDTVISKLFEQNATGIIPDQRFEILLSGYEKEQSELKEQNTELQEKVDAFDSDSVRADKFIEIVKRHTDFEELTPTMILEFVDKILVYEADKSSGERMQKVELYLNFIGKFDVPIPEPTPEEIAEEEQKQLKRERHREAQQRYVAKQKAVFAGG